MKCIAFLGMAVVLAFGLVSAQEVTGGYSAQVPVIDTVNCVLERPVALDTVYCTAEDSVIFGRFVSSIAGKDSLPFDSLILQTASFFLGMPYVASTLEIEPEGLVVNLRELDCTTFVENVIALSRMVAEGDTTFEAFCDQLRWVRYREGIIRDYTDRLHYTSDWIYENDRKEVVKSLGEEEGWRPYTFCLNFMSTHSDSYRQLMTDSMLIPCIVEIEKEVSERTGYYYIPKNNVDSFAVDIKNGDMVGFVTSTKGLDISHVAIVTRVGEELTFIHASSLAMKVIVNEESLQHYVEKSKSCTGIILTRPLSPLRTRSLSK
ncbi:xylanase [Bacteroidia bacterium]|nr:xylanase [Bacteroidia bacterium]GHU76031.1 xylanase [Bacteroidia bacterium]